MRGKPVRFGADFRVRGTAASYYTEFLREIHHIRVGSDLYTLASTGITAGGVAGALLCGYLSDRWFQSRRRRWR